MTTELRDYRIAADHVDEFVAAWLAGVVPLRQQHGYRIDAAWLIREENRFMWLMSLDVTPGEWETRNEAYYADPARAALDPDPAQWVEHEERWLVEPIS